MNLLILQSPLWDPHQWDMPCFKVSFKISSHYCFIKCIDLSADIAHGHFKKSSGVNVFVYLELEKYTQVSIERTETESREAQKPGGTEMG